MPTPATQLDAQPDQTTRADQLHQSLMQKADAWLAVLAMQRLSEHTLAAYHRALNGLAQFMVAKRLYGSNKQHITPTGPATTLDWQHCDKRQLTAYITKRLDQDNITITSAQQQLSAIRAFYAWLIDTNQVRLNPATGYRLKRQPRALPSIVDADLITQLLEQSLPQDPEQARLWIRDKAMFELMYSSGIRLSELIKLDVTDIRRTHADTATGQVRLQGKGGKTRIVPVGKPAMMALSSYLPHRELWLESVDNKEPNALFISEKLGKRLSARAVQLRLKKAANRAGIDHNLYPHLLRHCFASHMLSGSGDLRAVQEMLGHSDISTTQIYTHLDFTQLAQVYDNAHPRA